ncbi:MAG: flagellar FlbD family protein [Oligoflexales bacterium]
MIELTRLDQSTILVNLEAVKYVESVPDTLILFLNGDSVIVRESLDEIEKKWLNSKTKVLKNLHDYDE